MSYMRIIGTGRLSRDPELKNGATYQLCTFSVAVSEKIKDVQKVYFLECKAWGKQAEVIKEFLTKGSLVLVDGRLEQEEWNDKEGNTRNRFVVVVDKIDFLSPKKEVEQQEQIAPMPMARRKAPVPEHVTAEGQGLLVDPRDDLPF